MSSYEHVNGTQEIKRNTKILKSISLSLNGSSIVNSVNCNSHDLNNGLNHDLNSDSKDSQAENTVINQKIDKYGFFVSDCSYSNIW